MDGFQNLTIDRRRPGLMTVTIDMLGRPVNVVDETLLRDLERLIGELEHDRQLSLVVFRSSKESGFLAGADVKHIQRICSADEAEKVLKAGQELFDRMSNLPMSTLAVIHGPCLGGGLEFALACTWRIARDDASTRLGLPETQLGLIPGWGGTQRLPRLVGVESALRMILEGQRLPASKAKRFGLIDAVAPPERFEAEVQRFISHRLAGKSVRRRKQTTWKWLTNDFFAGRWATFQFARNHIASKAAHYPALNAALTAMETGLASGMQKGLAAERREFQRVLFTPTCRNLLDLFFEREKARRTATWFVGKNPEIRPIKTVAVLGAGTMGAAIAQLCAFEGLNVLLKDIRPDLVNRGLERIDSLMKDAIKSGAVSVSEADRRRRLVTGTSDTNDLAQADLGLEAVVEKLDIKQNVFRELDYILPPEGLIASNTSALPISDLASATARPSHVGGLHFFNPVHRMPLVEVVQTTQTSPETLASLVELVRQLGKVPVVVAESPGFLVNRILFPYLDEGVRLVCEGATPRDVDREAERFGMPMGPLALLDQVGLDVAADVARTLAPLSREPSPTPQRLAEMVSRGHLGKKSGRGFYAYKDDKRVDIRESKTEQKPKLPEPVTFDSGESVGGINQRLMLGLINTAAQCLGEEVVREAWMVDLAMVLGTGFAPFRGGPLKLADAWGITHVVTSLESLAGTCGPRFAPCSLLRDMRQLDHRFFNGPSQKPAAAALHGGEGAAPT